MKAFRIIAIVAFVVVTGAVGYAAGVSNGRDEGYRNGVASVDEIQYNKGKSAGYTEGYNEAREKIMPVVEEIIRVAEAQNYALSQSNRSTYCDFDQDYFGGYSGYCR